MHAGSRALVLGGGGSTGNAWLIGFIAGLSEAGLDVTDADLVIGTSAGSTAAAQVTGGSPAELFTATIGAAPRQHAGPARVEGDGRTPPGAAADTMERTATIIAASADAGDMRRRLGAAARELEATSDGAAQSRWRATVASRLPHQGWPERTVLITAVDAGSGEPVVFHRQTGVAMVDAIAASCASGFAYRIGDKHYIDGGYRRNENADLAAGCERVLVLSPLGGRTRVPLAWGMHLAAQVAELRAKGSRVETVTPDSEVQHMFGANAMDLSLRPAAARAGYTQATALAEELTAFWR